MTNPLMRVGVFFLRVFPWEPQKTQSRRVSACKPRFGARLGSGAPPRAARAHGPRGGRGTGRRPKTGGPAWWGVWGGGGGFGWAWGGLGFGGVGAGGELGGRFGEVGGGGGGRMSN